jgi:HAMP domain-containing protein
MRHGLLAAFALGATGLLGATFLILQPVSPAVRLANEVDFDALIPAATLGSIIAPKKALNETARAELGRSTWRLLHTMAQRYPDKPTDDERQTFKSFIYLLSRLYPCAECAAHFQTMLKQYPPQTANRNTGA